MKITKFLAALVLAAACVVPAQAATKTIEVAVFVSEVDEPLDTFMLRIAPTLERYTAETGWEACGWIGQSEKADRYAVRIGTTKGALTCGMRKSEVPEGFRALSLSIHSHPQAHSVFPSASDVAFYQENREMQGGDRMVVRRRPERRAHNATFSPADYAVGPGYLVDRGSLHYQEGPGTQREVAPLSLVNQLTAR